MTSPLLRKKIFEQKFEKIFQVVLTMNLHQVAVSGNAEKVVRNWRFSVIVSSRSRVRLKMSKIFLIVQCFDTCQAPGQLLF